VNETVLQVPERPDACWNCLDHKDTRVVGHGWYACDKCGVKWRRSR
jgi:hypothetical protein